MKSSTYATGSTVKSGSDPIKIVVIGASVGGLAAFEELLPSLPQAMCPPMVIVQHRGKETRMGLCNYLQKRSHLPVREPEDKEAIEPGNVYLAPADYHLMIEERSFALSTAAPVYFARPSIDVLFETAADSYGARAAGIILTGNSRDGAAGLARIKRRGGLAIIQEPLTAQARVMPEAALALAPDADMIFSLQQISVFLSEICSQGVS